MPLRTIEPTQRDAIAPYVTKDGSEIRELMHPAVHGNAMQSLAEATVPAGARTIAHRHAITEELYHFTAGAGVMRLGDRRFRVRTGDTVCIPPGTTHALENDGDEPLVLLCACTPAYSHDDTELVASDDLGSFVASDEHVAPVTPTRPA